MVKQKRTKALAVVAALIALNALGCGGGGNGSQVEEGSLSKQEIVQEASALCLQFQQQGQKQLFDYQEKHLKAGEAEIAGAVVVPVLEEQLEEMKALGAPRGEGPAIQAIIGAYESALQKAQENPHALADRSTLLFAEYDRQAKKYGFAKCAYLT